MTRRRVVTGLDDQGRSVIVDDGPSPGRLEVGEFVWEELWAFAGLPTSLTDTADPAAVDQFRLTPPGNQIACRLFTVRGKNTEEMIGEQLELWESRFDYDETEFSQDDTRFWHRTPTVDVIVIVAGEMELTLDGGEVVQLTPGDSVIQRGTMHTWRSISDEPAVAVAFMVRAE